MTSIVQSCVLLGVEAHAISICATSSSRWEVCGMTPAAAKETAVRLRSALLTIGRPLPDVRVTLSSQVPAPPTHGALDLPILLSALVEAGIVPAAAVEGMLVLGEVGLDGEVRPVRGVLAAAQLARVAGLRGMIVPRSCAWEVALVDGLEVLADHHLDGLVEVLLGRRHPRFVLRPGSAARPHAVGMPEVRGQALAVEQVTAAVAAREGVLLVGSPGTGKTMIARGAVTLLPAMTQDEVVEVTCVHSIAGLAQAPCTVRPFRAPHHTVSSAALSGGVGANRRPGELQLACRGVLYLDELPEFSLASIAALGRALREVPQASRPLIMASATSCPCGYAGSELRACTCSEDVVARHQARTQALAAELGIQVTALVPVATLREGSVGSRSPMIG